MSSLPLASPVAALSAGSTQVLDDPLEWREFSEPCGSAESAAVQPENRGVWRSHVAVQGMTCAACAVTIEDALRRVPGVRDARVDSASARARIEWDDTLTTPSRWFDAIAHSGYRAVPAPDAVSHDLQRSEHRRLLWRWLVAGFCMMQVMMYAYPLYVALPGEMDTDSRQLLLWASWVLSLPVVLFSCTPFLSGAWRDLRQARLGMDVPVALGIVISFVVSSAVTFGAGPAWGHEVWFDSLTMFVFFLLGGRWLELRLRGRTTGALDALTRRLPAAARRLRADGGIDLVSARRLVAGDRVLVLPGEAFAADGTVVQGQTHVDEALLTGESTALARGPGERVLAGSHNLTHSVQVQVDRLGSQTRYGEIVSLVERAAFDKPAIAALADRMARPFLLVVLLAAALAWLLWWPDQPSRAWASAVAVLIVTCPCALSLATPAAMLASAGELARRGVLPRGLKAIETLAGVDTVIFDKTGTLTGERLHLVSVQPGPAAASQSPQDLLRVAAALAAGSLHPLSRALVQAAREQGLDIAPLPAGAVREVVGAGLVVDAGVLAAAGLQPHAALVPEPQPLLSGEVRLGSVAWCDAGRGEGAGRAAGMQVPVQAPVQAPVPVQPAAQGTVIVLADERGERARFTLEEQLRDDAAEALARLAALGISARILSGDAQAAVQRVAQRAGIEAATGDCTPDGKLSTLQALQRAGHSVAMVGDGLNDAPVLASANVSFAMGHAAPLAQSRADFVVQADRLMDIAHAVALARRTMRLVRQNLLWAASYNAACIPLAMVGWMPAWAAGLGMAASSLLVIANAARLARHDEPARLARHDEPARPSRSDLAAPGAL